MVRRWLVVLSKLFGLELDGVASSLKKNNAQAGGSQDESVQLSMRVMSE